MKQLHGFPEFWYGWRLQIQPLAAAGFRVVAPLQRLIIGDCRAEGRYPTAGFTEGEA